MRAAVLLSLLGPSIAACGSALRIDGSTAAEFERSVAMLQNDLPPRRREELEVALTIIWMRTASLDAGDVDGDGDVDYFDARSTADLASALLAATQRGDLVSAVEKSKKPAVDDYFAALDGLGYREVVDLAGEGDQSFLASAARYKSQLACARQTSGPPVRGYGGRVGSRCE